MEAINLTDQGAFDHFAISLSIHTAMLATSLPF
jgi:hypothetical protein